MVVRLYCSRSHELTMQNRNVILESKGDRSQMSGEMEVVTYGGNRDIEP